MSDGMVAGRMETGRSGYLSRAATRRVSVASGWNGPTYYGRPQVKAAPFNNWVVGSYIFLAGLSGASSLVSAVAEGTAGGEGEDTARYGRYLALLAPTLGASLLVYDLHTPKRFYNMLRIAKSTSPMSIGTWNLVSFGALAFSTATAQALSDRFPRARWLKSLTAAVHWPAAIAGAGLSTYTASLLASTSTPAWAAAPQALAVRFGASSVASGAAALSLATKSPKLRRRLDILAMASLATELAATAVDRRMQDRKGVAAARNSRWGRMETVGATGFGALLPLGLYAASLAVRRDRSAALSNVASVAVLAGSAILRISAMGVGDESASRPDISLRFSQPDNLPDAEPHNRIGLEGRRRIRGGRDRRSGQSGAASVQSPEYSLWASASVQGGRHCRIGGASPAHE